MTSRQLPEEVEKKIKEFAFDFCSKYDSELPIKDAMSLINAARAGIAADGFRSGAIAALTDPSIYEAMGLTEMMKPGEYWHDSHCNASRKEPPGNDMCSCYRIRVKRLESQLTTANARIKELEDENAQLKSTIRGLKNQVDNFGA